MQILIIGTGYLGSSLAPLLTKAGHTVTCAGSDQVDITSIASLEALLTAHPYDLLINTAAYTTTSTAEQPDQQARVFAVNVQGPANLALVAARHHLPWVHFSTGMLFDGTRPDSTGWREDDLPTPTGYYAWTKAWADALLVPYCAQQQTIILRIHTPVSATLHPRNFLQRLQRFTQAIDIPATVTIVEDLATTLLHLVTTGQFGLFHAVSPEPISAFRITQLLQEEGVIAAEPPLTPMDRAELDHLTATTGGAHQTFPILSTAKLTAAGIQRAPTEERLRELIRALPPKTLLPDYPKADAVHPDS